MRSSAAVAGRALIMLACVVGIPAFALSGTSWSEMLKKLQDVHWPAILDIASASTSNATGTPAAGNASARLAIAGAPSSARPMSASAAGLPGQSDVVPASYQASAELAANSVPAVQTAGAAASTSEPYDFIQKRLRQLGATYYLLESWGNQEQLYRFYCKMAVGGSSDYTRYFEATNSDPLQAMGDVLRQVQTWKEGGGVASYSPILKN